MYERYIPFSSPFSIANANYCIVLYCVMCCSGNYQDSLACCVKAQELLPSPSHLAHGCMGLAHQYRNDHEAAVNAFTTSYALLSDSNYEVCKLVVIFYIFENGVIFLFLISFFVRTLCHFWDSPWSKLTLK